MKKSQLRKLIAESIKQLNEQYFEDYDPNDIVPPVWGTTPFAGGLMLHCPLGYTFIQDQPMATAITGLTPNLETGMLEQAFQMQADFPFTGISNTLEANYEVLETRVSGFAIPFCQPHPPIDIIGGGGWETDLTTGQYGLTEPFCCDTEANNYCEYQNGDDVEQCDEYIMANGPEGDLCDIDLCAYLYNTWEPRSKKQPQR